MDFDESNFDDLFENLDNNENEYGESGLTDPKNRISEFVDYTEIEEIKPEQLNHVRACVFVESYLSDPAITVACGPNGKFFAYVDDSSSDFAWTEGEVATWIESVESYQAANGGI